MRTLNSIEYFFTIFAISFFASLIEYGVRGLVDDKKSSPEVKMILVLDKSNITKDTIIIKNPDRLNVNLMYPYYRITFKPCPKRYIIWYRYFEKQGWKPFDTLYPKFTVK